MSASRIPMGEAPDPQVLGRPRGAVDEGERNKTVVRRLLPQIFEKGTPGAVDELFAPNFVNHAPLRGAPANRAGVAQMVETYHKAFPESELTLEQLIAEGDRIAVRFTISGTHHGDWMGISPTGRYINVVGLAMGRMDHGKLVEGALLLDRGKLMEQLGAGLDRLRTGYGE